jgi:hypothetical protein
MAGGVSDGGFCISGHPNNIFSEIIGNNVIRNEAAKPFVHFIDDLIPRRTSAMCPGGQGLRRKDAKFFHHRLNQVQGVIGSANKRNIVTKEVLPIFDVFENSGKNRAELPSARIFIAQPVIKRDQRASIATVQKFLDLRIVVVQVVCAASFCDLKRDIETWVFHSGFSWLMVEKDVDSKTRARGFCQDGKKMGSASPGAGQGEGEVATCGSWKGISGKAGRQGRRKL